MADAIYPDVAEFMTDTVTFTAKSSVDKYNKPTFSGETTVTGRLIYETTKSIDAQGSEVISVGRLITLGPYFALTVSHKMNIGSQLFLVHGVDHISDENGAHHSVIRFGR